MTHEHLTVLRLFNAALLIAAVFAVCSSSFAQTESPIISFNGDLDGATPATTLIADSAGNYYGTTFSGGSYSGQTCAFYGCGIVFELSPNTSGGWSEAVLYPFTGGADGANPAAGLVFDSEGNLYGTTSAGGLVTSGCNNSGCGTVFEISPSSSGFWTETTLYKFKGGNDGWYSEAPVTFDAAGNLYGTTSTGGPGKDCTSGLGCGEVFKLTPNGAGGWNYSVVHFFSNGKDGGRPYSGVVVDNAGNIFTSASQGGSTTNCGPGCGTVDEFSPSGTGYTLRVLHAFTGIQDGWFPQGGLALDDSGKIYAPVQEGGHKTGVCQSVGGCGVVLQLTPNGSGGYTPSIAHSFTGAADGYGPTSDLTVTSSGVLYGAAYGAPSGAPLNCFGPCGFVYKLTPSGTGTWSESVVYAFTGGTDGGGPAWFNGVIVDSSGHIFGAVQEFGLAGGCSSFGNGCGVAYEITP
jgi:hypothetical protein